MSDEGITTVVSRISDERAYATTQAPTVASVRHGGEGGGRSRVATTRLQAGFGGGFANIPIILADSSPMAGIHFTLTRYERLQLYKYYAKTDPYVGRAIDIHSTLPLSRMSLEMPKSEDQEINYKILADNQQMIHRLQWFRQLKQILRLYFRDGDVFIWFEWDEDKKSWGRVFILPPEYCHTKGCMVLLEDGTWSLIENVQEGDKVVTHRGNVQEVAAVSLRKVKEKIYKLKQSGFSAHAEVTGDHPYWVHRKGRRASRWEWIKVKDLKEGDSVLYQVPTEEKSVKFTKLQAELMGVFLAEGVNSEVDKSEKRAVRLVVGAHEKEWADELVKQLEEAFPPEYGDGQWHKTLLKPTVQAEYRGSITVRYNNQAAVKFFSEAGHGAANKKVPQWALYANSELQRALLRGYTRGDGHESKRGDWVANSASPQLVQDLRWLWTRLGAWCRDQATIGGKGFPWKEVLNDTEPSTRERQKAFRLTVPEPYVCLLYGATPEKTPHESGQGWSKHRVSVLSEEVRQEEVYHLQVGGDESYIVDGSCVHNCHVRLKPWTNEELIVYARPAYDTEIINQMHETDVYTGIDWLNVQEQYWEDEVPEELKAAEKGHPVPLNTDPYKGSCVFHFARNRTDMEEYGESMVDRVLETLLGLENLKNAQLQISSRNMSPKHMIWAEGIAEGELDDLRDQVDLSLIEPDYPIVTNYRVSWEVIGVNQRMLDVGFEYEQRLTSLSVGLGLTREFLMGEGMYSGQRINLQVLNTEYMDLREQLKFITEEILLKPVSWAKGYIDEKVTESWKRIDPAEAMKLKKTKIHIKDDGTVMVKSQKVLREPLFAALRFNRLSIRDDVETFDILFQLYLKGSLDVSFLLDLFNIDDEENAARLIQAVGTIKDPQFNQLLSGMYMTAGQPVLQATDLLERIIKGLNLKSEPSPIMTQLAMGLPPGLPPEAQAQMMGMPPPGEEGAQPEGAEPRPGQGAVETPEGGQGGAAPPGGGPGMVMPPAKSPKKDEWWRLKRFRNSEGEWVKYEDLTQEEQVYFQEKHLSEQGSK